MRQESGLLCREGGGGRVCTILAPASCLFPTSLVPLHREPRATTKATARCRPSEQQHQSTHPSCTLRPLRAHATPHTAAAYAARTASASASDAYSVRRERLVSPVRRLAWPGVRGERERAGEREEFERRRGGGGGSQQVRGGDERDEAERTTRKTTSPLRLTASNSLGGSRGNGTCPPAVSVPRDCDDDDEAQWCTPR